MGPITVLVTGVGGGGYGEQILKALRLATTSYDIVATDVRSPSKGFADSDHQQLLPPASDPAYIDELLRIAKSFGVRAIFHGSDSELRVLSDHRDRIRG